MSGLDVNTGLWLLLAVCGSVVGLDAVSWPQVMISRPIVAATLGGALLGDPAAGFLVGAVLEIFGLGHTPYGAAVYPETGPAGLVAGAGLASSGDPTVGAILIAASSGWVIGWIGAASVRVQRRINERLVFSDALATVPRRLERRHRLAMVLDALRAGTLTAAFAIPVMVLVRSVGSLPAGEEVTTASAVFMAGMALAGGVGAGVMRRHGRVIAFLLAGVAVALLLILTTHG